MLHLRASNWDYQWSAFLLASESFHAYEKRRFSRTRQQAKRNKSICWKSEKAFHLLDAPLPFIWISDKSRELRTDRGVKKTRQLGPTRANETPSIYLQWRWVGGRSNSLTSSSSHLRTNLQVVTSQPRALIAKDRKTHSRTVLLCTPATNRAQLLIKKRRMGGRTSLSPWDDCFDTVILWCNSGAPFV